MTLVRANSTTAGDHAAGNSVARSTRSPAPSAHSPSRVANAKASSRLVLTSLRWFSRFSSNCEVTISPEELRLIATLRNCTSTADVRNWVTKYISREDRPIAQNGFRGRNPWGEWGRRHQCGHGRCAGYWRTGSVAG